MQQLEIATHEKCKDNESFLQRLENMQCLLAYLHNEHIAFTMRMLNEDASTVMITTHLHYIIILQSVLISNKMLQYYKQNGQFSSMELRVHNK